MLNFHRNLKRRSPIRFKTSLLQSEIVSKDQSNNSSNPNDIMAEYERLDKTIKISQKLHQINKHIKDMEKPQYANFDEKSDKDNADDNKIKVTTQAASNVLEEDSSVSDKMAKMTDSEKCVELVRQISQKTQAFLDLKNTDVLSSSSSSSSESSDEQPTTEQQQESQQLDVIDAALPNTLTNLIQDMEQLNRVLKVMEEELSRSVHPSAQTRRFRAWVRRALTLTKIPVLAAMPIGAIYMVINTLFTSSDQLPMAAISVLYTISETVVNLLGI